MGICLLGTGTVGNVVWPGTGIAYFQGIPPDFYPPRVNAGTAPSAAAVSLCHIAPPHISTCLCISPPPTLLDECGFFKFLVVGLPYSLIFLMDWGVTCFEVQL